MSLADRIVPLIILKISMADLDTLRASLAKALFILLLTNDLHQTLENTYTIVYIICYFSNKKHYQK